MRDPVAPRHPMPPGDFGDFVDQGDYFLGCFGNETDVTGAARADTFLGCRLPFGWMGRGGRGGRGVRGGRGGMTGPGIVNGMEYGWGIGDWGRRRGHRGGGRGGYRRGGGCCWMGGGPMASMAEQFQECRIDNQCEGNESDSSQSSNSSSSSSSSSSDNENDGDGAQKTDAEKAGQTGGANGEQGNQQGEGEQTTQSNETGQGEKLAHPTYTNRGCGGGHGRRHGRRHRHGHGGHKRGHRHHHLPHAFYGPPPPHGPPPHLYYFEDYRQSKKIFKKTMKQWYKAHKTAWKQRSKMERRGHRGHDDGGASFECEVDPVNEEDLHPHFSPPWMFFPQRSGYDLGRGRRGCGCAGKKGDKKGKRGRREAERSPPRDQPTNAGNEEEPVIIHDEGEQDGAPMDDQAE